MMKSYIRKNTSDSCLNLTKNTLAVFVFLGFTITILMKESSGALVLKMITTSDGHRLNLGFSKHTVAVTLVFNFLGYIWAQVIGSLLARRVGGSPIFVLGVSSTSVLTLLVSSIIREGDFCLMAVRFAQGVSEGLLYPSSQEIWSYWAPVEERSRLLTFGLSGSYFGEFLWLMMKNLIISANERHKDLTGIVGLIYCGLFLLLLCVEYLLLSDSCHHRRKFVTHIQEAPLKKLFLSAPVWAIICVHCVANFSYFMIMTDLPDFFHNVGYSQNLAQKFSSLLYLTLALTMILAGALSDCVVNWRILPVVTVRKCFVGFGFFMQAIFLVCLAKSGSSGGITLIFVSLAMGFETFARVGLFTNMFDFAPQYASMTMALSNMFASMITGVCSCLTSLDNFNNERKHIFWVNALLNIIGLPIFFICASAKILPWTLSKNAI